MTPRKPSPRHKVTVEVGGEKLLLRSDVPPEYTRSVAAHLDATLRALPGFPTMERHRASILAALSITDELFHAREEIRFLRDEAERRSTALAELLESAESPATELPGEGEAGDAGSVNHDDTGGPSGVTALAGDASDESASDGTSAEPAADAEEAAAPRS